MTRVYAIQLEPSGEAIPRLIATFADERKAIRFLQEELPEHDILMLLMAISPGGEIVSIRCGEKKG